MQLFAENYENLKTCQVTYEMFHILNCGFEIE